MIDRKRPGPRTAIQFRTTNTFLGSPPPSQLAPPSWLFGDRLRATHPGKRGGLSTCSKPDFSAVSIFPAPKPGPKRQDLPPGPGSAPSWFVSAHPRAPILPNLSLFQFTSPPHPHPARLQPQSGHLGVKRLVSFSFKQRRTASSLSRGPPFLFLDALSTYFTLALFLDRA